VLITTVYNNHYRQSGRFGELLAGDAALEPFADQAA
jgi:hypothetical protein